MHGDGSFVLNFEILVNQSCSLSTALCGVVMYNYIKVKDVRASQLPAESLPERIAKVGILRTDIYL